MRHAAGYAVGGLYQRSTHEMHLDIPAQYNPGSAVQIVDACVQVTAVPGFQ